MTHLHDPVLRLFRWPAIALACAGALGLGVTVDSGLSGASDGVQAATKAHITAKSTATSLMPRS